MDSIANVKDAASSGGNCEIDPRLYKATTEGNIEPFKENEQHDLDLMVTPIKNTVLHIHIISPDPALKSTEFVKQIVDICPSLLLQVNANGDTPLHVAATCGHSAIVEVLIECAKARHEELESGLGAAKKMLRMTNKEGNTALHEAVMTAPSGVVKILTKEDPEFSYSANHYGETPLFLAAAERSVKIVAEILETCTSAAHGGPDGKTALHAAVMTNDTGSIKKILEKKEILTKETDQNGWTPLHYAAYYDGISTAQQLLESDKSAAYTVDKDRKMTALHVAASQGSVDIMEAIIFQCPDCCQIVDNRGWNFLHFAMISLSVNELRSFLAKFSANKYLLKRLIKRKDVKGNTPLHVLAACRAGSYMDIMKEFGEYRWLCNKQNDSVQDILVYGSAELEQEIKELSKVDDTGPYRRGIVRRLDKWDKKTLATVEKSRDSHLVVAALIATVTFAAAFTMPGGYKNEEGIDEGTSILTKKTAFQAFVITDAMAMIFSLFAVFGHFIISKDISEYMYLYDFTFFSTLFAMGAMVVAFVTGTYAVLTHSLGLAIANCVIGLSFFFLVLLFLYKIGDLDLDAKP